MKLMFFPLLKPIPNISLINAHDAVNHFMMGEIMLEDQMDLEWVFNLMTL